MSSHLIAQELPITGLAGVGLAANDLAKARHFYSEILGLPEAFSMKNDKGKVISSVFKVNDDQYVHVLTGAATSEPVRTLYLALETSDAQGLRKQLLKRGVIPGAATKAPDGTLTFSLRDPNGTRVDFVELQPDSMLAKSRGKIIGEKRVAKRLAASGVVVSNLDASMAFYRDSLGFAEFLRGPKQGEVKWIQLKSPGTRGDFVEFGIATLPLTRDQYGQMQFINLEVPDLKAVISQLHERGLPGAERLAGRAGRDGKLAIQLLDPDGTRVRIIEVRGLKTQAPRGQTTAVAGVR